MTVSLKKNYSSYNWTEEKRYTYDYYTCDERFFINKEKNQYVLYSDSNNVIRTFKTLKACKERIQLIKDNPLTEKIFIYDIDTYEEACKNDIKYWELRENNKEVSYIKSILEMISKLKDIAALNNYKIIKSPYSLSFYAIDSNEEISWSYKPLNSYRFSNHWNWKDQVDNNIIHCRTASNKDYGLCICKYIDGCYHRV